VTPFLSAPSTIVPFLLGVFIYGPFPEELGWRGYALDRLQARWNALVSTLILGAIWALWHLPLFFIKDTLFYSQGAWSPWFWLFVVGVIPTAVIYTWIFNNTRRSTLAAILFHFMSNVTYEHCQCDSWDELLFDSVVGRCGDSRGWIVGRRYANAT